MIPCSAVNASVSSSLVPAWTFISRPVPKSKSNWATALWAGSPSWPNLLQPMPDHPEYPPAAAGDSQKLKIYFLPNLLTAGNLFCGFVALTRIVEANIDMGDYSQIKI